MVDRNEMNMIREEGIEDTLNSMCAMEMIELTKAIDWSFICFGLVPLLLSLASVLLYFTHFFPCVCLLCFVSVHSNSPFSSHRSIVPFHFLLGTILFVCKIQ